MANAGDSRGIIFRHKDGVVALSVDHKPNDEVERARIENAGGKVWFETALGKGTTFYISMPAVNS